MYKDQSQRCIWVLGRWFQHDIAIKFYSCLVKIKMKSWVRSTHRSRTTTFWFHRRIVCGLFLSWVSSYLCLLSSSSSNNPSSDAHPVQGWSLFSGQVTSLSKDRDTEPSEAAVLTTSPACCPVPLYIPSNMFLFAIVWYSKLFFLKWDLLHILHLN